MSPCWRPCTLRLIVSRLPAGSLPLRLLVGLRVFGISFKLRSFRYESYTSDLRYKGVQADDTRLTCWSRFCFWCGGSPSVGGVLRRLALAPGPMLAKLVCFALATASASGYIPAAQGVHVGITCDGSGMSPIVGTRYHLPGGGGNCTSNRTERELRPVRPDGSACPRTRAVRNLPHDIKIRLKTNLFPTSAGGERTRVRPPYVLVR